MTFPGSDPRFESLLQGDLELQKELREHERQRELALTLVDLRRRAGLTQRELAEKAGWDPAYVSRLESGRGSMPELRTAHRYAEACNGKLEVLASLFERGVPAEQAVGPRAGASKGGLYKLFVEELRDIYHAEKQITRALPKMAKAATAPELKQAFELHLEQTRGQIERLDQVFEQLDLPKRAKKCEAMEGLLEEARAAMEEIEDATVLDVGMIINAQKVEHYEIAGYGSLVALAKQLGHDEAAHLLDETLAEEKQADQKLNEIAEAVNAAAEEASEESGGGRKAHARALA